jgi:hypothetical protein
LQLAGFGASQCPALIAVRVPDALLKLLGFVFKPCLMIEVLQTLVALNHFKSNAPLKLV